MFNESFLKHVQIFQKQMRRSNTSKYQRHGSPVQIAAIRALVGFSIVSPAALLSDYHRCGSCWHQPNASALCRPSRKTSVTAFAKNIRIFTLKGYAHNYKPRLETVCSQRVQSQTCPTGKASPFYLAFKLLQIDHRTSGDLLWCAYQAIQDFPDIKHPNVVRMSPVCDSNEEIANSFHINPSGQWEIRDSGRWRHWVTR